MPGESFMVVDNPVSLDPRIVISFLMLLLSAYVITGFLLVSVRDLFCSRWRAKRVQRPSMPLFSRKKVYEKTYIVSLKDKSVVMMSFSFKNYRFERDDEVVAWRELPDPYRGIFALKKPGFVGRLIRKNKKDKEGV